MIVSMMVGSAVGIALVVSFWSGVFFGRKFFW